MNEPTSYVHIVERSDDDSYWAYLPGCTTVADSFEAIEGKLREAVDLYMSYYKDRGLPPPPPRAWVGTLTAA